MSIIDYDALILNYKWHDVYNTLPFIWKCPFCATLNTLIEDTKNVPIKCTGARCDGNMILI